MFNQVNLVGNVGKDPDVRYTASGKAVASFSLATSKKFKDNSGQTKDETQWHRIVVWGKLAEVVGEYVHKGTQMLISGEITYRKYDHQGQEQTITEIVANTIKLMGGKKIDSSVQTATSVSPEEFAQDMIPF